MQERITRVLLILAISCIPILVGSLLLVLVHGATVFDFAPSWSDEIYYWHQTATFREAGFSGGYYTVSEQPAPATYSHFYTWGAFVPAFYGTIARAFGWELYSHPIVNAMLVTTAIGFMAWSLGLRGTQMSWLGLVLATFVPLQLGLPTNMQHCLHFAIAIVAAGGFSALLKLGGSQSRLLRWSFAIFIAAASLVRPTWALLFAPFFVLTSKGRRLRDVVLGCLKAAPVILGLVFVFHTSAAPYPHFRKDFLELLSNSPLQAAGAMFTYVAANLGRFWSGPLWVIGLRVQVVGLGLTSAWIAFRPIRRGTHISGGGQHLHELLFHCYNLTAVYLTNLALHETWDARDYYVLAPHLLLSLILLVTFRRWRLLGVLVLTMLIVLPSALLEYSKLPQFDGRVQSRIGDWREQLSAVLRYDPGATNSWCNSLSHSYYYIDDDVSDPALLLAIDGRIGFSWIDLNQAPGRFKARYLMLTQQDYARLRSRLNVEVLGTVPNGKLYLNNDAACGVKRDGSNGAKA